MNRKLFLVLAVPALLASCTGKPDDGAYAPQSFDELKGHTVCLLSGSVQQDYATAHFKGMNIDYVYFSGASDCMMAVNQKKADVFFGADLYAYNEAFRRQHLKVCHVTPECGGPAAFGVKKGNTALSQDLNAFVDSLTACGAIQEMLDRWFDPDNTDFHSCVKVAPVTGVPAGGVRVLKVGNAGVKPPAEVLIDNKWSGCETEVLQLYAQSRGLQLQIEAYDFDQLIPALQSGKIDVASSTLSINKERSEKIDFIHPFITLYAAFIIPDPAYSQANSSFWEGLKESAYYSLVVENRWELIVTGFWATLRIAAFSLLLGMLLGGVVCWLRMSRRRGSRLFACAYINVMRNIPMLVFLMLMFYVFLADTGLPTEVVAILAFGLNSAAYISEIYRTGIEGVDRGQTEAGLALGFSPVQTFCLVVAPQAARKSLPVFQNQAVTLLKGTSVVGYISIIDLTKASDLIRGASFEAFFPLFIVTLVYFVLAWIFTTVIDLLVRKL